MRNCCSILSQMRNVHISLPANAAMLVVALDVDVVFLLMIYLLSTDVVDVCFCFCAIAGLNCELALGLQCLLERAHEFALGLCPLAGLCVRFSLLTCCEWLRLSKRLSFQGMYTLPWGFVLVRCGMLPGSRPRGGV